MRVVTVFLSKKTSKMGESQYQSNAMMPSLDIFTFFFSACFKHHGAHRKGGGRKLGVVVQEL